MKFNCILCKGQDYFLISLKTRDSNHRVVRCTNCSYIQLYPLPTEKDQTKFYNQDQQTKLLNPQISIEDLQKKTAADTQRRVTTLVANFSPGQSILDVGTGYGFFLKSAAEKGFKATGLEIGSNRLIIARRVTTAPIWTFRINGPNKTKEKFDIVTLFHVLEHITDPIKFTQDLQTYFKKDGRLIIEIPNAQDYMLKISSAYKDFYWQIAHISYFTPKTVSAALKRAGYSKIKITGVQRYSFINALNWLLFRKPQLETPTYNSRLFSFVEDTYKKYLVKNEICDTFWIEAKV